MNFIHNKLPRPVRSLLVLRRAARFGAVATAISIFASGCGQSAFEVNEAALEKLENGEYNQAEQLFAQAIRIKPDSLTLRRNLVEVYLRQERWDDAIRVLTKVLEVAGFEKDLETRSTLAKASIKSGNANKANLLLRELTEEEPENEEFQFLYGLTSTAPGKAIDALEKALNLDPGRDQTYLALARARAWNGEFDKAREILDKSMEKFGPSPEAKLYQVALFLRENDTERAAALLAEIRSGGSDLPLARLFEGYLALADRRTDEAQSLFESLEESSDVESKARLGAALCYLIQDDTNMAIEICNDVLLDAPEKPEPTAYNLLGLGQLKRLQKFLAKKNFEQSLDLNPDQPAIKAIVDNFASR